MAKARHPHKWLLVNNGRTWKCMLSCTSFVHRGLQHVLIGTEGTCWGCDEIFIIDDIALENAKPMCMDCRLKYAIPSTNPISPSDQSQEETELEKTQRELREQIFKSLRKS